MSVKPTGKETLLAETFVALADTLVDDFDVIDTLTTLVARTIAVLGAEEAGILLAGPEGDLHVVAASSEAARLLELLQLQTSQGPCLDCVASGRPVHGDDLSTSSRWPKFAPVAAEAGFLSVTAIPLRLRDRVIGGLNMFMAEPAEVGDDYLRTAQALAAVATIAILQDQAVRDAQRIAAQLQGALDSRTTIEQAKGMLAERAGVDMDEAFNRLRRYSRDANVRLTALAAKVVGGDLPVEVKCALLSSRRSPAGRATTN
ncbi:MAG TPA: GAF and ANTAR domain-containing protein [Acidimicrobiales bacterium]|nr:GAF and ANTAR domain-containing protein [Acidimicrobiales bacterium]